MKRRKLSGRPGVRAAPALGLVLAVAVAGCTSVVQRAGMALLYRRAELPAEQVRLDLAYVDAPSEPADKQRLDLFLPDPALTAWPVLIFVHGGGWVEGDRAMEAAGQDVYRNVGRYFAAHGVGTAVISYRLQPEVSWHEQLADVASAVRFVKANVPDLGGDPARIFLSGHSAGAWLTARLGLDPELQHREGLTPGGLCGLLPVSGAAYDLADPETYTLGASRGYFVEHFDDGQPGWEWRASVTPLARADSPATLIVYGLGEQPKFRRQNELLARALRQAGAPHRVVGVPGEDHSRMILTLSRDGKETTRAMLAFIEADPCGASRSRAPAKDGLNARAGSRPRSSS